MQRKLRYILFVVLLLFLIPLKIVKADDISTYHVYDEANILTDEEEETLSMEINEVEKQINGNLLIYTYSENDNIDYHVDSWYTNIFPLLNTSIKDGTFIYAINMETRTTLIIGYDAFDKYNFSDNSSIVTDSARYLSNEEYLKSCEYFIYNINSYRTMYIVKKVIIFLVVDFIIVFLIMFSLVHNSGGKRTTTFRNYLNKNKSTIYGERDIYLRKTVTKHAKSSSSSSGGHSSGGHSHGSGGHGHF